MAQTKLDLAKTALVTIDLQENILHPQPLVPHAVDDVVATNNQLANHLKNTAALITLVGVNVSDVHRLSAIDEHQDERTIDRTQEDITQVLDVAHDTDAQNVIQVTKHNPGAFFGTDLDLQLRRHGIDTIILNGVSTSNGVYATALDAYQSAYRLIVVADACSDRNVENHEFILNRLMPRIGEVTTLAELLPRL